jgi:putative (di)nucleoside polyphosphate hydrolase
MIDPDSLPYRPCVGVVLMNAAGEVFAGERVGMQGAWQMPQGGIDDGEEPRQAALRELAEETSVPSDAVELVDETPGWLRYDLPGDVLGKVWGGRFRGQEQKWFLFRLTGPDSAIDLATDHPEFGRWRWMGPRELLSEIVAFKRPVYEQVFGIFADHLAPG